MNSLYCRGWLAGGLLIMSGVAAAGPVNYVDVRKAGINIHDGTVYVQPINGQYAKTTTSSVPYHVQMKAGCNGANRLKEGFVAFGSENVGGTVLEYSDNYRVSVPTRGLKDLPYQDVVLHVPTNKLHADPVAMCRSYMNTRLSQGANKQQILASKHTINRSVTLTGVALCGRPGHSGGTYGSDKFNTTLKVVCKSGSAGGIGGVLMPGQTPGPKGPNQMKAPTQVTHVSILATPPQQTSKCPATVTISGSIVASGAGSVKYRIPHIGAGTPPSKTLIFTHAGAKTFYEKITINSTTTNGWARLTVLSPNKINSKQVNFSVHCSATPNAPSNLGVQPKTPPARLRR